MSVEEARHQIVVAAERAAGLHRELGRAIHEGRDNRARQLLDEITDEANKLADLGRHAGL